MIHFIEIRKNELQKWACCTGHGFVDGSLELISDNLENSIECSWQNKSPVGHVNLFCSLGEWACNYTDLLNDERFDKCSFEKPNNAAVLFRHYTRILLVVSELFTDFQDIYLHAKNITPSSKTNPTARKFYFPEAEKDNITLILNYINRVCKHKTQHIHICNNHFEIHFEDSGVISEKYNYVGINDVSTGREKNAILVPKLSFITDTLIQCYISLDQFFADNQPVYLELCKKFASS
jgi:hypothetical protein